MDAQPEGINKREQIQERSLYRQLQRALWSLLGEGGFVFWKTLKDSVLFFQLSYVTPALPEKPEQFVRTLSWTVLNKPSRDAMFFMSLTMFAIS